MSALAHVLITGGTGYVGAHLARVAMARGHAVTVLARDASRVPAGAAFRRWTLGDPLPAGLAPATLFHIAHDWTNAALVNEDAAARLLESARQAGVTRFVFMSSQSAQPDAATAYGLVKWRIEQMLDGADTASARVGPIYGGQAGSLYGQLVRLIALPALPMIRPGQLFQPIHIDEVCDGLLALAASPLTGPRKMAAPVAIPFGAFLRILARETLGKRLTILPVPLWLALLGCTVTEYVPVIPTVSRARVLGLAGIRFMPCADDLAELGLTVEPVATRLRRGKTGRKGLLIEGRALLRYLLGTNPGSGVLRDYVRALRRLDPAAGPVGLPGAMIAWPAALALMESLRRDGVLERRLDLAASLAEASPDGVRAFHRPVPLWRLAARLAVEALVMPIRVVLTAVRRA